jgi:hypothetical protein
VSSGFRPRLDILPAEQRALWPELRPIAGFGFALYGGTAISLRLGHRPSVDFDFFSDSSLERDALRDALPFLSRSTVVQDRPDAWTVLVPVGAREVKVSFFGGIDFGRVDEPEGTTDGVVIAASLVDLLATKLTVIFQRAEAKDYRDVAAILGSGISLETGLSAARALFGSAFQPSESLRALVFFGDGDLETLSSKEKSLLIGAATTVRRLPETAVISRELGRRTGS